MSGRFGLMLPIFVVGAVLMMVIPVSPLVLDLLLTLNIAFADGSVVQVEGAKMSNPAGLAELYASW